MKLESEKEVMDAIQLLGWKDISTRRQMNNGTIIYELPILKYGSKIQVGSFKSGYIRRMNGCYTPYQLNKCENYDHYYKEYKSYYDKDGDYTAKPTGKYNKCVLKRRILIDNEYDRINYLITYCLKNYYINQANEVENGKFIPKWKHENELKYARKLENKVCNPEVKVIVNGQKYKVI